MLADDDSDDADMFQEVLSEIDPAIIFHRSWNGFGVLETLEDKSLEHPDIIFLDINMPGMDGWQCLSKLKNSPAYRDIPVIIYSTSSHLRDAEIALDLGALCFITKPSDFNTLKKILQIIVLNLNGNLSQAMSDVLGIKEVKCLAVLEEQGAPPVKNLKN